MEVLPAEKSFPSGSKAFFYKYLKVKETTKNNIESNIQKSKRIRQRVNMIKYLEEFKH